MKPAHVMVALLAVTVALGTAGYRIARRAAGAHGSVEAAAGSFVERGRASQSRSTRRARRSASPIGAQPRFRIGDEFYGIRTQADADWRERNLYPTSDEIRAAARRWTAHDLEGAPTPAMLARLEFAGMTQPELRDRAIARLTEAAARGSMYAVDALFDIAQYRRRDVLGAETWARVAELRGDWRMRIRPYPRDEMVEMEAGVRAQAMLEQLELQRRRMGLPPLTRDPPPGLDEFMAALDAQRDALRRTPAGAP